MCYEKGSHFVVPIKEASGLGWFLARIISRSGNFLKLEVMWTQVPQPPRANGGDIIISSTPQHLVEFDNFSEAFARLQENGAIVPPAVF